METNLIRENRSICLIDVGGQRSERRKWIHLFDGVNVVIFVAAMSEYDEVLFEDDTVNCMHESLKLFGKICGLEWFMHTPFMLFLNKKDVLAEKLVYSPLVKCFKDYTGGDDQYKASDYIWEQFHKENKFPNRQLYFHFTCAKDTENIHFVFDMVVDTIMAQLVGQSSLY